MTKIKLSIKKLVFLFTILLFTETTFGQTIFSQNFESSWTLPATLTPAWSGTSTPADNVWHQSSYTTGWTRTSGAYSPLGANSTSASARFHTYDALAGSTGDFISPTINLSAYTAGTVKLNFYHINTSGSDVLNVYSSDDNGASWSIVLAPSPIGISTTWSLKTITLPGNSATTKIKFTATSDYGVTDIGIDEIRIYLPVTPAPPTNLTFSAIGGASITANWIDNSNNENGFRVYYSTDNVTFFQYGSDINSTTVAGTGSSYSKILSGLNIGTTYYFRIVAFTDLESTFLVGNATTLTGTLTGIKTIGPSGDYTSIALAINDLNNQGVGAGGVTFNIPAAYTETFTSSSAGLITASGTAANPIIFQKIGTGANPLITAGVGVSTSVDGIIVLRGSDYITFDGIDLTDRTTNTTPTTRMEWGYALVKTLTTDGAQYNIIKNCFITLNKANTASAGIYFGNHTNVNTTALEIKDTAGTNSYNKIDGNIVSNTYNGIYINGFIDVSPYTFYDQGNEIGVNAANTISNFGGASSNYAIYLKNNNNFKVANNIITNSGVTSASIGIYLAPSTNANGDVNNNDIQMSSSASTTQLTAIQNAIAGTGTINIFANNIHGFTYPTATTGPSYYIYNQTASANVNIYSNIISNNTSSATTGAMYCIYNTAVVPNLNIYGNTISNNTASGTITFAGILNITTATNTNIYNNTINGNQILGSFGTLYGVKLAAGIISLHDNAIFNNTIPNTTGTADGVIYGYYNAGSPSSETIYNNQIYGLSIGGTTSSPNSIIRGVYTSTIASAIKSIYSNQIYNLSITSTGGGLIDGISQALGSSVNIYKNNIYDLSALATSGTVNGIYIASGTTNTVSNNFISDLKTPDATGINAINGIKIVGGTTANIYYNSIYLNAISSSTSTFGSSGIFKSSTTNGVFRNNIISNNSTPGPTGGFTIAHQWSGLYNATYYGAASNNNCFYAGIPSASNLIFYDGTNADQTLVDYKSRVSPKDVNSISVSPFFNSATDLHLIANSNCAFEGSGSVIAGITTDIDGDTRNTSTPDIGADEFSSVELNAPIATDQSGCLASLPDLSATVVGTALWYSDAALSNLVYVGTPFATGITSTGVYTFYVIDSLGTCLSPYTMVNLTAEDVPLQPSVIDGLTNPLQNSTQIYSVTDVPGVTYTWTFPSDWIPTPSTTNSISVLVGIIAGDVTCTPSNTCGDGTAQTLFVTPQPDAIGVYSNNNHISIYPNPTSDIVTLTFKGLNNEIKLKVLNVQGGLMFTSNFDASINNFTQSLDLTNYPNGMYYIQVKNNGKTYVNKIVKLMLIKL